MIAASDKLTIEVEDFNGQVRRKASDIPKTATVSDLVDSVSRQMGLPEEDAQGRQILYGARNAIGEMLNPTEKVGDVIKDKERVTLTTSVTAG